MRRWHAGVKFYVYVHNRPGGRCFYIGKGSRGRAWTTGSRNKHWRAIVASCGGFETRIVDEFDDESAALAAEVELLELAVQMGAALSHKTAGGEGGSGLKKSAESIEKTAAFNRGKRRSPDAVARTALGNRGQKRTDEAREYMRRAQIGATMSPEAKAKVRAALTGRPVSAETRAKIAAAHRGKKLTAEHKAKLAAAKRGKPWPAARRSASGAV
jgi:hypothetical protein